MGKSNAKNEIYHSHIAVWQPLSSLYRGPPSSQYIHAACNAHCICPNVGPSDPNAAESSRPEQCVINNVADNAADAAAASAVAAQPAACTGLNYREPESFANVACSSFYGEPVVSDCNVAATQMYDSSPVPLDTEEFLESGTTPTFPSGFRLNYLPLTWPTSNSGRIIRWH